MDIGKNGVLSHLFDDLVDIEIGTNLGRYQWAIGVDGASSRSANFGRLGRLSKMSSKIFFLIRRFLIRKIKSIIDFFVVILDSR